MRVGLYLKSRITIYYKELYVIATGALSLFLMVSLWSYNPYDSSWFYYSSMQTTITNGCGVLGAHVAALLWYFFGLGAWGVIGLLLMSIYLLVQNSSFARCWERLIAAGCVIAGLSVLLSGYSFGWLYGHDLGGALGLVLYSQLRALVGMVGTGIVVMMMLIVASIIAFRVSHERMRVLMHTVYTTLAYGYHASIRFCTYAMHAALSLLYSFVTKIRGYVHAVRTGSWYKRTTLIVPSDDYAQDLSAVIQKSVQTSVDTMQEPVAAAPHTSVAMDDTASAHKDDQDRIEEYVLPSLSLFIAHEKERTSAAVKQELEVRAQALEEKLQCFGISGSVVEIKRGPVVTVFEYLPAIDTKLSKIISLEDDLAMALQALSIRILAPIPGTAVVGFEVANKKRHDVLFAQVIKSAEFVNGNNSLPLVLGKDTIGNDVIVDLVRMPHLLIAGSTGSGKSIALNTMLVSLLCKRTPDEMRLVLIDPKRLEFASYADIAHLLFPIVTDPQEASPVLGWVVQEMERRYEQMAACGVRNVSDYNRCTKHASHTDPLPYIVVVIDELADLMMTAGREVEDLITRITQMARAAGIHMIVATQRPSVDVITGLIKVNFPSRISFRVTSKIDSRTILDCSGADKLLGRGDMLFLDAATSALRRVHGAYITNEEIEAVVEHIRAERTVQYLDIPQGILDDSHTLSPADDQLYAQVIDFLSEADEISISLLQRKFKIGYNRSARIIEFLELKGMILPSNGAKTRKVVR